MVSVHVKFLTGLYQLIQGKSDLRLISFHYTIQSMSIVQEKHKKDKTYPLQAQILHIWPDSYHLIPVLLYCLLERFPNPEIIFYNIMRSD